MCLDTGARVWFPNISDRNDFYIVAQAKIVCANNISPDAILFLQPQFLSENFLGHLCTKAWRRCRRKPMK
jgi:hypothetical protein